MEHGIEDLLSQLIEEHEEQLRSVVRKITGRPDSCETVLQDTYLAVLSAFNREDAPRLADARAYLFRAVNRNATRHLVRVIIPARKAQGIQGTSESVAFQHDPRPGPESMAVLAQAILAVSRALEHITPNQREVFVLGKINGLKRREIAQRLALTEGAVDERMTSALASLRRFLKGEGWDRTILELDLR